MAGNGKAFVIIHKETKEHWIAGSGKSTWATAGAAKLAWAYTYQGGDRMEEDFDKYGIPLRKVGRWNRDEANNLFKDQTVFEVVELGVIVPQKDVVSLLKKLAETHKTRLADNKMLDGRMRWDYYGVQRRIASAAVNYGGYIVTGVRHFCPIMRMQIDAIGVDYLLELAGDNGEEEGFIDQYGNFLTRKEAYIIAKDANQLLPRHAWGDVLYSESYV